MQYRAISAITDPSLDPSYTGQHNCAECQGAHHPHIARFQRNGTSLQQGLAETRQQGVEDTRARSQHLVLRNTSAYL